MMAAAEQLVAPFPYFGGKRRVAAEVWARFGDVPNYVEPFFGSGAVLLARPVDHTGHTETINDADGLVANFWRAVQQDPDDVAAWADWPVNEIDLHARHGWLLNRRSRLLWSLEDPDFYDAKIAGWWVWGACQWIAGGWCAGTGPWHSDGAHITKGETGGSKRQLPHLGNAGRGLNRKLPHLGGAGRGAFIAEWLGKLSERLREVRVCCGDWSRVLGPSPTTRLGVTGVFLDPPYSHAERAADCYAVETDCSGDVRAWAIDHGDDPKLRIALCGYDDEHELPDTWDCWAWKAHGGYGNRGDGRGRENAGRERIWFSPHCLAPTPSEAAQLELAP